MYCIVILISSIFFPFAKIFTLPCQFFFLCILQRSETNVTFSYSFRASSSSQFSPFPQISILFFMRYFLEFLTSMPQFCFLSHILIPLCFICISIYWHFSYSMTIYFVDQQFLIFNHNIYVRRDTILSHQEDIYWVGTSQWTVVSLWQQEQCCSASNLIFFTDIKGRR